MQECVRIAPQSLKTAWFLGTQNTTKLEAVFKCSIENHVKIFQTSV